MPTTPRAVAATLTLLLAFCMDTGWAADPAPGGRPAGQVIRRNVADNALFASSIWAGDTLYVSGMLPTPAAPADAPAGTRPAISGDTKAQTLSALTGIQKTLREQGLDMGDVVQMRVYLVGDPALGGKMDFAGMNAAYSQFFGSSAQPNRPVRATVQVAALAVPAALVEIEVVAVRSAAAPPAGGAR